MGLCAKCDGEVGIQQVNGFCGSFCERALKACQNEYIDLEKITYNT